MTTRVAEKAISSQVAKAFDEVRRLTVMERLALASLLLESVLTSELSEDLDWTAMALEAFQKDWDNVEDAIYDDWREHYGIPAR